MQSKNCRLQQDSNWNIQSWRPRTLTTARIISLLHTLEEYRSYEGMSLKELCSLFLRFNRVTFGGHQKIQHFSGSVPALRFRPHPNTFHYDAPENHCFCTTFAWVRFTCYWARSSWVDGDEGSYRPISQMVSIILQFCKRNSLPLGQREDLSFLHAMKKGSFSTWSCRHKIDFNLF